MALTDNLVAYWKLDESSGNAADSASTNTLTNTGVTYSAGKINNGAVFVDATDYLSINDNAPLSFTGDFSASFWINLSSFPASEVVGCYGKFNVGTQRAYLCRLYNNAGSPELYMNISANGTTATQANNAIGTLSTGTWYHIVTVYDASAGTVELYKDGILVATQKGHNTSIYNGNEPFSIGYDNGHIHGSVDEFGLWNKVLTRDEVFRLYNAGRGNQYLFTETLATSCKYYYKLEADGKESVAGVNTLAPGTAPAYVGGKIGNGGDFELSSSQYIEGSNFAGSMDYTCNWWFKPESLPAGGVMVSKDYVQGVRVWSVNNGTTQSTGYFWGPTTTYHDTGLFNHGMSVGNWYMWTVVWDSTNNLASVYINGSSVGTHVLVGNPSAAVATSPLTVGRQNADSPGLYIDGIIDEIGYWERALTTTEITSLYASGTPGTAQQYPFTNWKYGPLPIFFQS